MMGSLRQLYESSKEITYESQWQDRGNDNLELIVGLKLNGVAEEGFTLIGNCKSDQKDVSVSFQMQIQPASAMQPTRLARVDWRPYHSHQNPLRDDPSGLGLKGLLFSGSHHHSFRANYLEKEDRMLRYRSQSGLRYAEALDKEPSTYSDLLDFIEHEFNITNLSEELCPPPWHGRLI